MRTPLSPNEDLRYVICKKIVSDWLNKGPEVGARLAEIRDDKLYRAEFDTFEDYCRSVHQLSRPHAYRLIDFAEIKMSPVGDKIENERQAREIKKVPPKKRGKLLEKLMGEGKPVTAKNIAEACTHSVGTSKPPKPLDSTGYPIPKNCWPIWERAHEIQEREMQRLDPGVG